MRSCLSIQLVVLLAIAGCQTNCGSGSGADASDGSARPEASLAGDAGLPDSRPDAGDATSDPCVVELPPSGQNEMGGFTNAGHIVTYAEYRGDPSRYLDVYYYHLLDRAEHAVTDRELGQTRPYVHGDDIIFTDDRFYDAPSQNYQSELYLYDIAAASETRLTDSPFIKGTAGLNRDYVLYESNEGCVEIFDFTLRLMNRHTQEVTVLSDCEQHAETISMSDGFAAWAGRPYPGHFKVVFVRDLQAGVTLDIGSTAPTSQFFPHADGDHVIWQDYRDGRREIYMYTLSTGQEESLTPDDWEQA